MKIFRLRTTVLLVGLMCLVSTGSVSAQTNESADIQQARFRDRIFSSGRLFGGREEAEDTSTDRWGREAEAAKPRVMLEPVKMPVYRGAAAGAPPRQTASTSSAEGEPADALLKLVNRAIDVTSMRYLDVNTHTPWQIMHGVLALREDLVLRSGNQYVRALDWISRGPTYRNQPWFEATAHGGRAHPFNVPFHFEGHVNQFLALLSLSNLPYDHQFQVAGGKTVTMADMIENAKLTVSAREEITWTLWFLTHYIDQDSEWDNAAGEPWSMEQLVRIQTQASVKGAPCGGTHGLFALAYARNAYLQKHHTLRGAWFDADQKVRRHIEVAKSLQNSDGSFSTEYFTGPGHSQDYNERIRVSGHTLECLMMMLPHSQLGENWVRRGVASVATDLIHTSNRPNECGPTFHAVSALVLYRDRMTPRAPAALAAQEPEAAPRTEPAATPQAEAKANKPTASADLPSDAWRSRKPSTGVVSSTPQRAQTDTPVAAQPVPVREESLPARVPDEVLIHSKPLITQEPVATPVPDSELPPLAAPPRVPDLRTPSVAQPQVQPRNNRLARQAAERIADMARRGRSEGRSATEGVDPDAASSGPERIAAEPADTPTRR